jgi:hypothetical protein
MRKKITSAALNKIPHFLDQGLGATEIAHVIGCTVGTLRVRCSQMRISLRQRRPKNGVLPKAGRHKPLALVLPPSIIDQLRCRAAQEGISDSRLASRLLEVIARDGLYDAVLDAETLTDPRR